MVTSSSMSMMIFSKTLETLVNISRWHRTGMEPCSPWNRVFGSNSYLVRSKFKLMHKDLIDMPDEEGDNEAMHCFSKNTLKLMAKGRVFRGGGGSNPIP